MSAGRRAWLTAAALVLLAPLGPATVSLGGDRLRVAAGILAAGSWTPVAAGSWALESSERDPWGRPFVIPGTGPARSLGPDGVLGGPASDDVLPTLSELALANALRRSPVTLVSVALLVLWFAFGPFVRRRRAPGRLTEVWRAAVLVSAPLVLVYFGVGVLVGMGPLYDDYLRPGILRFETTYPSVVSVDVAIAGAYVVMGWLAAYAWRQRRPLEGASAQPEDTGAGASGASASSSGAAPGA